MLEVPGHITLVFILTTLVTYILFTLAVAVAPEPKVRRRANMAAILMLLWLIFQSTLSLNGWYMDRNLLPPHLAFPVITSVVVIVLLFVLPSGKRFIDGLSLEMLTWLHIIRLPVEFCLLWLAMQKGITTTLCLELPHPSWLCSTSGGKRTRVPH
jgi:hypothetical protein